MVIMLRLRSLNRRTRTRTPLGSLSGKPWLRKTESTDESKVKGEKKA